MKYAMTNEQKALQSKAWLSNSQVDLGVAEFESTRRRKNKSRSPPEKNSIK